MMPQPEINWGFVMFQTYFYHLQSDPLNNWANGKTVSFERSVSSCYLESTLVCILAIFFLVGEAPGVRIHQVKPSHVFI